MYRGAIKVVKKQRVVDKSYFTVARKIFDSRRVVLIKKCEGRFRLPEAPFLAFCPRSQAERASVS
jgi:hypothetical protein